MTSDAPSAESSETSNAPQPVETWILVVCPLLVIVSIFMCAWMWVSAPAFAEMFRGFGAELPALTSFVLSTYKVTPLLLLLTLVPSWTILRNRHNLPDAIRHFWHVIAGFVLTWVVLGVFVAGMYMPIFTIGSAV